MGHKKFEINEKFVAVVLSIAKRTDLSSNAKLVYGALYSYRQQYDDAFPSQHELANDLGFSIQMVERSIRELKSKKLIGCRRRDHRRGNEYFLLDGQRRVPDEIFGISEAFAKRNPPVQKKRLRKPLPPTDHFGTFQVGLENSL